MESNTREDIHKYPHRTFRISDKLYDELLDLKFETGLTWNQLLKLLKDNYEH